MPPKMKFGFVRPSSRIKEYLDWVAFAERYSPDLMAFGDGQELWNELYVTLSLTAERAKKALIGPMVTNAVTRDPTVTASAIATLQEYTGGRAFLGIGTGLSALRSSKLKTSPLAELEEYVKAVQDLTEGKKISYRGRPMRIQWSPPRVPVFIGVRGPKGLALAGRIADGVVVGGGVTSGDVIRKLLGQVRVGAQSVGRDLESLPIWFNTRVVVAKSRAQGIDDMRDYLAGHAAHSYHAPAILAQAPPDVQEQIHVMERGYKWDEHLIGKVGPDGMTDNARLLEKTGIKEWLAKRFVIVGTADECVKGLAELRDAGATQHIIPQVINNQKESTRLLGEGVFPKLR